MTSNSAWALINNMGLLVKNLYDGRGAKQGGRGSSRTRIPPTGGSRFPTTIAFLIQMAFWWITWGTPCFSSGRIQAVRHSFPELTAVRMNLDDIHRDADGTFREPSDWIGSLYRPPCPAGRN